MAEAGMTKEQFMQQMGLTAADIVDPATRDDTLPVRGIDIDGDGISDFFIRTVDLTEGVRETVAAGVAVPKSEYRETELSKFRTTVSGQAVASTTSSAESPKRSDAERTADHGAASEYKTKMLAQYRDRKQTGVTKTATPARPAKPAAAAAAPVPSDKKPDEVPAAAPAAADERPKEDTKTAEEAKPTDTADVEAAGASAPGPDPASSAAAA